MPFHALPQHLLARPDFAELLHARTKTFMAGCAAVVCRFCSAQRPIYVWYGSECITGLFLAKGGLATVILIGANDL